MDRLRLFLGLSVPQFLETFPLRMNVCDHKPAALRQELRGSIFVLGRDTWRALGLPRRGWFEVFATLDTYWVLLPHPSGRNIIYNSKAARERAKRIVYRYLEQEEEGNERRSHRRPPPGNRRGRPYKKASNSIAEPVAQVLGDAK